MRSGHDNLMYRQPIHRSNQQLLEIHILTSWLAALGKTVLPKRGSTMFISTTGHIDGQINLDNNPADVVVVQNGVAIPGQRVNHLEAGKRSLMDPNIMASKLAYENAIVIKNVVNLHRKAYCRLQTVDGVDEEKGPVEPIIYEDERDGEDNEEHEAVSNVRILKKVMALLTISTFPPLPTRCNPVPF